MAAKKIIPKITAAQKKANKETEQSRTVFAKKAVLVAMEKSLGNVTTSCKSAKIGRTTYYEWLNSDMVFKAAIDNVPEIALDIVEAALMKSIKKGSDTATIFFLKTKGKKRGYVERTEVAQTDKDGNNARPLNDSQLDTLLEELNKLNAALPEC